MKRPIVLGASLGAFAFVLFLVSLVFASPVEARGLHPDCNVTMPCAPVVGFREAARLKRGRQLEQAMPFGAPIYPPETQRSFLQRGATILGGRPAGCPRRFCGCGVSLKVFGRIIPRYNLAANWRDFAPTAPGGGTVAWRPGHVLYVEAHVSGSSYQVYDPNSGGGKIRRHVRNLAGYRFVDPHAPLRRVAER